MAIEIENSVQFELGPDGKLRAVGGTGGLPTEVLTWAQFQALYSAGELPDADYIIPDWPGTGAGGGAIPGKIELMPFRTEELPWGWYVANGDRFPLSSPQGEALDRLPPGYKEDWGLTIVSDTINVPNAYAMTNSGVVFFAAGLNPGDFGIDQMRAVTSVFRTRSVATAPATGAIIPGGATGAAASTADTIYPTLEGFNSALLGPHYDGEVTRPPSWVVDYQMKMYGAVTDAGTVQLSQLIAAMTGKLDTSAYEADAPMRVKAWGVINGNGNIVDSENIISSVRTSAAHYTVTSNAIQPNSIVIATARDLNTRIVTAVEISTGIVKFLTSSAAPANTDVSFNFVII